MPSAAIALLCASCSHGPAAAEVSQAKVSQGSQTLPDVTFQTAQDETIKMDFKGRVVFVDFWSIECPGCPAMRAAAERLYRRAAADTWFMGINEDGERQTWKNYMLQNFSALSEVWDKDHSFRETMGLATQPSAFVVDRGGHVRWRCPLWKSSTEAEVSLILDNLAKEPPPQ